jgi:hypothetical protein
MSKNLDFDINNYTIKELMKLFKLKTLTEENINNNLDKWLKKSDDSSIDNFIEESREKLLHTMIHNSSFLSNVYKTNHIPNRYHNSETTDENTHFIKTPLTLPIEQTHSIPFVRGQINPNLKNTKKRLLNIDTQYRPNLSDKSTDFIIDFSEPLNKIVQMKLIDFQIKHNWYTIDNEYGTDYLFQDNSQIIVPKGNYTNLQMVTVLNSILNNITVRYSENTNKISFENTGGIETNILFFDKDNQFKSTINNNLGWLLGYREINVNGNLLLTIQPGETYTFEDANIDLYGPKYLLLGINDYNQNMVNTSIITVYDTKEKVKLPDYFTSDISCSNPLFLKNGESSGLTIKQSYTITEILEQNNQFEKDSRNKITTSSDILGKIPVNRSQDFEMIFDNDINQRNNVREYYGPVSISRMHITLYDDKGNILNNNNQNYSFTLQVDELYQY